VENSANALDRLLLKLWLLNSGGGKKEGSEDF
jgi:hypothetical protein